MKNFLVVLAGLVCVCVAINCVQAEVIPAAGSNSVKAVEVSGHWRNGEPLAPGASIELGDELRALVGVTSLHNPPSNAPAYWKSTVSEEITGLVYDLELTSLGGTGLDSNGLPQTGTILYYSPLRRNGLSASDDHYGQAGGGGDIGGFGGTWGGVAELYDDLSPDLGVLMATNPSDWVTGNPSARDSFPNASDGSAWLSGVFLDLQSMGVISAPQGSVYMVQFLTAEAASGYGFVNIFDGLAAPGIVFSAFGPHLDATFATTISLASANSDSWQANADDPILFDVAIPEPVTLLTVGVGASLLGLVRRRRR